MYRAYATSQGVLGQRINRTGKKKKQNKINYNKLHMQVITGFFCWQVDEPITGGGREVKKQKKQNSLFQVPRYCSMCCDHDNKSQKHCPKHKNYSCI